MTFARLAKIVALALVAFALWQARPPGAPARIIILALPGASMDMLAGGEQATTVAKGAIALPPATSGAAFWRRLFASRDDSELDWSELAPLWTGANPPIRAFAAPAHLFGAPGDEEKSFVGSSAGVAVEAEDITAGRLPAPYDRAADAIAGAAATLGRDQWSDWIAIEPSPADKAAAHPPSAEFQFTRFADSSYFLSPAYVFAEPMAGQPFLRGKERELRPLLAAHAIAVTKRRLDPSRLLFPPAGERSPVVVFDTVAEDATAVFSPDSVPAAIGDQVREAVAAELARLREAGGSGALLVAIGGPTSARSAGTGAWYHVLQLGKASVRNDSELSQPIDLQSARATVRYVAGAPLEPAQKQAVPAPIRTAAIVPEASAVSAAPVPEPRRHAEHSTWTVEKLESVPGAVAPNH